MPFFTIYILLLLQSYFLYKKIKKKLKKLKYLKMY